MTSRTGSEHPHSTARPSSSANNPLSRFLHHSKMANILLGHLAIVEGNAMPPDA
jgi:hypothetical protein